MQTDNVHLARCVKYLGGEARDKSVGIVEMGPGCGWRKEQARTWWRNDVSQASLEIQLDDELRDGAREEAR